MLFAIPKGTPTKTPPMARTMSGSFFTGGFCIETSEETAQLETCPLIFKKRFAFIIHQILIRDHPDLLGIVFHSAHKPVFGVTVNYHEEQQIGIVVAVIIQNLLITLHALGQVILKLNRDFLSADD